MHFMIRNCCSCFLTAKTVWAHALCKARRWDWWWAGWLWRVSALCVIIDANIFIWIGCILIRWFVDWAEFAFTTRLSSFTKAFGKGIVVDFQFRNTIVLKINKRNKTLLWCLTRRAFFIETCECVATTSSTKNYYYLNCSNWDITKFDIRQKHWQV